MELFKSSAMPQKQRLTMDGEKLFLRQVDNSFEGFTVDVDGNKDIPMIIQKHTNPLNKNLHDMKAKYLDSTGDFMHIGNLIAIPQKDKSYKIYMAVTSPSSNGVYSEYKILPLDDDMTFTINNTPVAIKTTVANKGFYDEGSYTNEANVFEDKELCASIVQYNEDTKNLVLFDDVHINNEHYRIVKIDNCTLKEHDEEFGVIQLVVIDTPFGTIHTNGVEIKAIAMTARVKDKILNSISREILTEYNKIKRGDYIEFTYDRDKQGNMVTETYIVSNKPTMEDGYDKSLMYLCENTINLLNDKGEVVKVPFYFDDNRTRIDKEIDTEYVRLKNSSYLIAIQENELNEKLTRNINRIVVKGKAYRVTGFDPFVNGLIKLGLDVDQITPDDNVELGVANYYSQMKEINGTTPPNPSGITGDSELYLGYANQYVLNMPNVCTWSVDNPNVMLTDLGGNKCELLCDSTKELNKTVILTARIGSMAYEKSIKIVGL